MTRRSWTLATPSAPPDPGSSGAPTPTASDRVLSEGEFVDGEHATSGTA